MLQKLPLTALEGDAQHRRRVAESINNIIDFTFDDSRRRTEAERIAGVTPTNYAYPARVSARYGADNDGDGEGAGTDNATALGQMFTVCAGTTIAAGVATLEDVSGGAFRSTAGFTVNSDKVFLDGRGHILDFTGIAGEYSGIKLVGGDMGAQRSSVYHGARGIRNLVIINPAYTDNEDSVGLEIVDATDSGGGNYLNPRHTIDHVSIVGGQYGVKFGVGVFNCSFYGLTVLNDTGHALHTCIYAPNPWTDGGETTTFTNAFMGNALFGVHIASSLGSLKFIGGNIDGCRTIGKHDGYGTLAFHSVYFEFVDGDDTQYKFIAGDNNSKIEIIGCEFNVRPDLSTREDFAFASVTGTLVMRDVTFDTGNGSLWYTANGGFLVTGSGRVEASGIRYVNFPWNPLVSKKLQWLAYPDIDNANALAAFALANTGGGADPVRATSVSDGTTTKDAAHFFIGSGSSTNDDSSATFTHACAPGRAVSVVGQIYAAGLTSSNVLFELIMTFKDVDGNTLSTDTESIATTTVANWTTFGYTNTAPAGTETLEIVLRARATGTPSGDKSIYLSPLGIGYADGQ